MKPDNNEKVDVWEENRDSNGKITSYYNRITGETRFGKDRPPVAEEIVKLTNKERRKMNGKKRRVGVQEEANIPLVDQAVILQPLPEKKRLVKKKRKKKVVIETPNLNLPRTPRKKREKVSHKDKKIPNNNNQRVRKKKKKTWIQKEDEDGIKFLYNTVTKKRREMVQPPEEEEVQQLPSPHSKVVEKVVTFSSPSADIKNAISDTLVDMIRIIVDVDNAVTLEKKRRSTKKQAVGQIPISEFERKTFQTYKLPPLDIPTRRRMRSRIQGQKYRHLILNKTDIAKTNDILKQESINKNHVYVGSKFNILGLSQEVMHYKEEMELDSILDRFKKRDKMLVAKKKRVILQAKLAKESQIRSAFYTKLMAEIPGDLSKLDLSDPRLRPGYVMSDEEHVSFTEEIQNEAAQARTDIEIAKKVFIILDDDQNGLIPAEELIDALYNHSLVKSYAAKSPALTALIQKPDIQEELKLVDVNEDGLVSFEEFTTFLKILSEVSNRITKIKKVVEKKEEDAEARMLASWEAKMKLRNSRILGRNNSIDQEQVMKLRNSRAALQASIAKRKTLLKLAIVSKSSEEESHSPLWQQHHYHRIIRISSTSPLFCCICRRRRWELAKLRRDEAEEESRNSWEKLFMKRLYNAQVQIQASVEAQETQRTTRHAKEKKSVVVSPSKRSKKKSTPTPFSFLQRFLFKKQQKQQKQKVKRPKGLPHYVQTFEERQVWNVLQDLVKAVVKNTKSPTKQSNMTLKQRIESRVTIELATLKRTWQAQALERVLMYEEDEMEKLRVEIIKRDVERPFRLEQEIGHRQYLSILTKCHHPSPVLNRLQWERTLKLDDPFHMTIQAFDRSEHSRYVVRTVACASLIDARRIRKSLSQLQKSTYHSPHVVRIHHHFQHTLQSFASNGALVDQTILLIVVEEHCSGGVLQIESSVSQFELFHVAKDVASGLAVLHRQGIIHENLVLRHVYKSACGKLKIGSFLFVKDSRETRNNSNAVINQPWTPPEMMTVPTTEQTLKFDIWTLGCVLFSIATTAGKKKNAIRMHELSMAQILRQLPIRFKKSVHSLFRMTLQAKPELRSTAAEIFDYACLEIDSMLRNNE